MNNQVQCIQTLANGAFSGDANALPLVDTMEAHALVRLGWVSDSANDLAFIAQCDDFAAPSAGWGLGLQGTSLVAFAVDDVGLSTASVDLASGAANGFLAQGGLLCASISYTDGGAVTLGINGSIVDTAAMGGAAALNSATAPFAAGADATAGANSIFELVGAAYGTGGSRREAFEDALSFGYFSPNSFGLLSGTTHIWNARYSVMKAPRQFNANGTVAPVLINQGSSQNAAETVGNLTSAGVGNTRLTTRWCSLG